MLPENIKACSSDSISFGLGRVNPESRVSVHRTVTKVMSNNTPYYTQNVNAKSHPIPYLYNIPVYNFEGEL